MTGQTDFKRWFSDARLGPYLAEAAGDETVAEQLYEWNARLSAACLEVLGHLEVLLRNAVDRELSAFVDEQRNGIPWFLMRLTQGESQTLMAAAVETARERLQQKKPHRDTRDQIIAAMNFGFWTNLLGKHYDALWRSSLHRAFPHSSGLRKDLSSTVDGLRIFRNRLAHPDSLLAADVLFQLRQAVLVAGWIDPLAADWLQSVERVTAEYAGRPIRRFDTVVVPAREAFPFYEKHRVYICQAGRTFRPVERIAFYADQEIKPAIPFITKRMDNVEWTEENAARLGQSADSSDLALAEIIREARRAGWTEGRHQVFWLSGANADPRHRALASPVPHHARGKGSAFTQRQRYASLHALETAASTADLD